MDRDRAELGHGIHLHAGGHSGQHHHLGLASEAVAYDRDRHGPGGDAGDVAWGVEAGIGPVQEDGRPLHVGGDVYILCEGEPGEEEQHDRTLNRSALYSIPGRITSGPGI